MFQNIMKAIVDLKLYLKLILKSYSYAHTWRHRDVYSERKFIAAVILIVIVMEQ